MRLRKSHEILLHALADDLQVRRDFAGHAAHLEAAAEAQARDFRQMLHDAEGQARAVGPGVGIGARADVGVHAGDPHAVFRRDGLHLVEVFVPDAEAGGGAAHVGAVAVSRTEAGVDADGYLGTGEELAVGAELVHGAGVEEAPAIDEGLQIPGQFLGGNLDPFRGDSGAQSPLGFKAAAGVDIQSGIGEHPHNGGGRQGLHGIACGESESVGEGEDLGGALAQRGFVVYVKWGAEFGGQAADFIGGKKTKGFHGGSILGVVGGGVRVNGAARKRDGGPGTRILATRRVALHAFHGTHAHFRGL